MQEFHKYEYDGPVLEFDRLVCDRWFGETMATSVNKAKNNLVYQFKKKFNRIASAKITLPGDIKEVD